MEKHTRALGASG